MMALHRNAGAAFVGQVIYSVCQWGVLVALTHKVDPGAVGEFGIAYAVAAPVFLFSNLQLRDALATDVCETHGFADYLTLRVLTTVTALALLTVAVLALYGAGRISVVIVLVALSKAIDALADIFAGRAQRSEKMARVAAMWATNGLSSFVLVVFSLRVFESVVMAAVAVALGSLAGALVVIRAAGVEHWQPRTLSARRTFDLGVRFVPLGVVASIGAVNAALPRLALEQTHGLEAVGLFSAVAYFGTAGATIVAAVAQSSSSRLATLYQQSDRVLFRRFLMRTCAASLALGAIGVAAWMLLGRQILAALYGPQYTAAYTPGLFLLVAAALGYPGWFLNMAMVCARSMASQSRIYIATCVVALAGSWILVPRYGVNGAAWVFVAMAVVHVTLSMIAVANLASAKSESVLAA